MVHCRRGSIPHGAAISSFLDVVPIISQEFAKCSRHVITSLQIASETCSWRRTSALRGEVLGVFPANGGFDLARMRRLDSGLRTSSRKVIAVKGYQDETWGGRALNALEALKLSATQLSGFEVVIFSATSEVKSRAEALAKEAGLQISVLPPSPNDEIIKLMGRSRIAIGIGLTDGSPVSLLEAMIMGAFPIQADTVSTGEWIRDGENGFLVPPEEPESIARAIQRALIDDELVERAAKLNKVIADQRLDQAALRPRIVDMYRKASKCASS